METQRLILYPTEKAFILYVLKKQNVPSTTNELVQFAKQHQPHIVGVTHIAARSVISNHLNHILSHSQFFENLLEFKEDQNDEKKEEPENEPNINLFSEGEKFAFFVSKSSTTKNVEIECSTKYYVERLKFAVKNYFKQHRNHCICGCDENGQNAKKSNNIKNAEKSEIVPLVQDDPVSDLLQLVKTVLNQTLPKELKEYDPWNKPWSTSTSKGINLGICHATGTANISLNDMKGLSTLKIQKIESNGGKVVDNKFTLHPNTEMMLQQSLVFKVNGSCGAKCGFIHPHVSISGKVVVKTTSIKASGDFVGFVDNDKGQIVLQDGKIESVHLEYGTIDITIDGLGVFNALLVPIKDAIELLFKDQILGALQNLIHDTVNDALQSNLPIILKL